MFTCFTKWSPVINLDLFWKQVFSYNITQQHLGLTVRWHVKGEFILLILFPSLEWIIIDITGIANNNSDGDNGDNDENAEFRRQHFDRTSILRHSKKRKKSSAGSNPASVNGTPIKPSASNGSVKPVPDATPARVSSTPSMTTPGANVIKLRQWCCHKVKVFVLGKLSEASLTFQGNVSSLT